MKIDILKGQTILYLHNNQISHNDITTENIFYDIENKCLVLLDFDRATIITTEKRMSDLYYFAEIVHSFCKNNNITNPHYVKTYISYFE